MTTLDIYYLTIIYYILNQGKFANPEIKFSIFNAFFQ